MDQLFVPGSQGITILILIIRKIILWILKVIMLNFPPHEYLNEWNFLNKINTLKHECVDLHHWLTLWCQIVHENASTTYSAWVSLLLFALFILFCFYPYVYLHPLCSCHGIAEILLKLGLNTNQSILFVVVNFHCIYVIILVNFIAQFHP
jgi:hypothetical protein